MSNQTRKDKVKVTLFDIKSNIKYRQYIVGELSNRVDEKLKPEFIKILNQVIDDTSIFDREDLEGSFYEGEDDTLDLVLPAVAKVLHKIFLKPPPIFQGEHDDGKRLELFQIMFDIDEFNEYLVEMLISSKGILDKLKYLDRTAENISLIVDNYVAKLVNNVLESYDIEGEIIRIRREKKLNFLTK
jgi:hypothetical protein